MAAQYSASQEGYLHENYRYFHLRDTAGQERDFHFHDFDKLVILISGRVDYAVEDSTYALRPWDVLLVRRHTIHKASLTCLSPTSVSSSTLTGSFLTAVCRKQSF